VTRQHPRRPASSRAPVSRPRRVAGQRPAPEVAPSEAPEDATHVDVEAPAHEAPGAAPAAEVPPAERPADVEPEPEPRAAVGSLFGSRRATRILVVAVVVLGLVAGGLFAWDARGDDTPAQPSSQPVVISGDDATAAVDAAAKAAETIVAVSWQDYDKEVDEAAALMTQDFATKYRATAGDIKDAFVKDKTVVQARVVAQGVVHATRTEVQALVFLNQYISKDGGDTTYTPYRALVTVLHTDAGWLVSNLDTK
jgi:Mce-associated membrane protein